MLINQILLQFSEVDLTDEQLVKIRCSVNEAMVNCGIDVEYFFYDQDSF